VRIYTGKLISKQVISHLTSKWFPPLYCSDQKSDRQLACSKIESFIRSKYESRKWVLSDRPPRDPSTLESESQPLTSSAPTSSQAPQPSHRATGAYDPPPTPASRPAPTIASAPPRATPTGQRTAHPLLSATAGPKQVSSASLRKLPQVDLLSGDFGGFESSPAPTPTPTATLSAAAAVPGNRPPTLGAVVSPAPTPAPAPAQPAQTSNSSLFELDFKPPTVSSNKSSHKDIMSLFSSAPPVQAQTQGQGQGQGGLGDFGSFGGMGSFSQPQQQEQQAGRTQPPLYSPPSIATNPQAGYASWNASSGITSSTGGAGAGMNGITSGFGGMGLGADPWSTPVVSFGDCREMSFRWLTLCRTDTAGTAAATTIKSTRSVTGYALPYYELRSEPVGWRDEPLCFLSRRLGWECRSCAGIERWVRIVWCTITGE
jgi:hypothetical protein